MTKNILTIALAATMLVASPMIASASEMIEIVDGQDMELTDVNIALKSGNVLHITNAQGMQLQVFNVAGVCILNVKVDSDDKQFDLNLSKGCYIVKVGKTVRKISVK